MRKLAILSGAVLVALFSSVLLGSADSSRTVNIAGTVRLVIDNNIAADFRFSPGPLSVKSGERVTWSNGTTDGHSISVVNEASLPTNVMQVFNCGAPGTVCAAFFAGHFPANGPPIPALGNAANGQLKAVGDSFLIGCTGTPGCEVPIPLPRTMTMTIAAPAGSTLHYMCIFHPWMQGEIDVN